MWALPRDSFQILNALNKESDKMLGKVSRLLLMVRKKKCSAESALAKCSRIMLLRVRAGP